jgi:hypothetical protein
MAVKETLAGVDIEGRTSLRVQRTESNELGVLTRRPAGPILQWQGDNLTCNGGPNADGTPAFDRSCGGHQYNLGNGQVSSAWPARIMQFALKFIF